MPTFHHPEGPRGDDGQDGQRSAAVPIAGHGGANGQVTVLAGPSAILPMAIPLALLESLLDRAELMFINGAVDDARIELVWMLALMPPLSPDEGDAAIPAADRVLVERATLLLSYMERGLDAFGRGPDYLDLRTFEEQKEDLFERLELADKLVEHAKALSLGGVAQKSREASLATALDSARGETDRLLRRRDDLGTALAVADAMLLTMRADLDAAWMELSHSAADFKNAVERGHCAFEQILEFGAMVATAYATGGAALAVVSATSTALKQSENYSKNKEALFTSLDLKDVETDGKQIAGIVKPVVASIKEFRDAYEAAKEALKQAPAPKMPHFSNDYVKLVVDKAQFDKQIEPFMALPEAQKYKSLMQRFVDLAEARNNKILERDAGLSEYLSIHQNLREVEHKFEIVAQATSAEWDERVPEVASLYDALVRRLAPGMARNVLNLSASTRMYLPNRPVRLLDLSIAAIRAGLLRVKDAYERIEEMQGQPAFKVADVSFKLTNVLTKTQLDDFVQQKPVVFSLPRTAGIDAFPGYCLVQTLRMRFEDERAREPNCQIAIQSLGSSAIRGVDGEFRMFNHAPVAARYGHGDQGETPGALQEQGDRFIGVSPYGPWRISAVAGSADVLKAVAKGKIKFDVEARQLRA